MHRKTVLLIMLTIFPAILMYAQGRPGRDPEQLERFRSMKIAYFTEKLGITAQEAEKFWPVYNELEKQRAELHSERRRSFRNFSSDIDNISDAQAAEMIQEYINYQKKDLELETEFYSKIKEILPPKKIMKLYITEMQFREYMINTLREQGEQGSRGRRGPDHP